MTLVVAWIRRASANEELVVACDSRLTGGLSLDHAPKIFPLERNDAVLAYCGPTVVAYPILLQVKASLDAHYETRTRVIDLVDLKSHIKKTIEGLRVRVRDLPSRDGTDRSFKFLLAGYSWKYSQFRAWTFRYDSETGEFNAHSMPRNGHDFVFMSDMFENEFEAKRQLMLEIFQKPSKYIARLNWEPLKVLLKFIRDGSVYDVGGPPQIIKVYRHSNILPINVLWPEDKHQNGLTIRTHQINHLGRPLLGYERTRLLTIDTNTWELIEPWQIRDHAEIYNECERRKLKKMLQQRFAVLLSWRSQSLALQAQLTAMQTSGASFTELQNAMLKQLSTRQ